MIKEKSLWHKRVDDFESFDRIEFVVVPRYKTSGLSGDEWRQHVQVNFYFKGEIVHEEGYRDMQTALMLAPGAYFKATCPIPDRVLEMERIGLCDQPSCASPSIGRLELKQEFERGRRLHEDETKFGRYYRQFCAKHIRRGDCSREDSDDNYIPLDGPAAEASTNLEESPSVVMTVNVPTEDKDA